MNAPGEPSYTVDFLAQILEHVAHPIFVKDREFRFVLVNEAFCAMVGRAREEMLGKTDYDFFAKEEADFFRAKDVEMFTGGRVVVIAEEPITDAGGHRHVLATTKAPLRSPSGEVTHLVGIIHDITRLKVGEEALRVAKEDLERRVEERSRALALAQEELVRKERLTVLGRLAGGVAHEIRNPLAAIKNATYVISRVLGESAGDEARKAMDVIHDEIARANRIITGLLDYARVRAPDRRPVPVLELLERALGAQEVPATVEIVRAVPEGERVVVDGAQVESALSNVLRNAVEAMPSGGTLEIRARRDGGRVHVLVGDTGCGIAAEIRKRLFEPLVTSKQLGLGLGLVTARTLIEGQGGSISLRGTSPNGTTFEIVLPAE
jgi:PAS domain S-box-containing protein